MNVTVRQGSFLVESPARGILRLRLGVEGPGRASPIGIVPPASPYPVGVEESSGEYRFDAGSLKLRIGKTGGGLVWETEEGGLLLSQPFPEMTAKTVYRYRSAGGPVHTRKTVDGERNFSTSLVPLEDRSAWRAKVFFDFADDEGIHGLGQAEEGIYDYRRRTQYLYQHNMRIPVPFFLSTRGYGVLFDCGCLMTFNGGEEKPYFFLIPWTPWIFTLSGGKVPTTSSAG